MRRIGLSNPSMAQPPEHGARAGRRRKLKKSYEYEVRWAGAFSHPEHDTWLTRDQCAPCRSTSGIDSEKSCCARLQVPASEQRVLFCAILVC